MLRCAAAASAQPAPETVYAPPPIREPGEGVNEGGLRLDLRADYATDYVFRGFEPFEVDGSEDSANGQAFAKVRFDLDKLPSPFVSVFANGADGDDISTLQELRPTVGFDWDLRLFTLSAGHTSYLYPDRDELETGEIFAAIEINDAAIFGLERPVLTPFAFAAYDYDRYDGLYVEAGVRHTAEVGGADGLSLTFEGLVAYVDGYGLLSGDGGETDGGFPFYQLGIIGGYELNDLLNLSRRYGDLSITGRLHYTDGIDDDLRAETQLWGGAGVALRY